MWSSLLCTSDPRGVESRKNVSSSQRNLLHLVTGLGSKLVTRPRVFRTGLEMSRRTLPSKTNLVLYFLKYGFSKQTFLSPDLPLVNSPASVEVLCRRCSFYRFVSLQIVSLVPFFYRFFLGKP